MDEALKKLLTEMAGSVKALNETIAAKFSSVAPTGVEAEKDALIKRIQELETGVTTLKNLKAVRKMAWSVGGASAGDGVQAKSFADFMKAVVAKDAQFLENMGVKTANGQSEGTNADGGFTVPTEYANEIIKLERQNSIVRRIARLFPMGSLTRKVPRQLTNPTVTWTGEATNHTKTKATVEQITQTAKKLSALVPVTEELLADNNVNLDAFLFQVVAEAMGREEDRVAFVGNTGSSDPFDGIYYASGVNSVSMVGANLDWKDLVSQMMTLKAPYRLRGRWVLGTTGLSVVMKLRDDQNRPIWTMPSEQAPGAILGMPYDETDQIAATFGSNSDQTPILFGDFGRSLWLSDRASYEVKASDSASDANAGAGSAFLQDEIWYKFRKREAITVAQPEAFAKMLVK